MCDKSHGFVSNDSKALHGLNFSCCECVSVCVFAYICGKCVLTQLPIFIQAIHAYAKLSARKKSLMWIYTYTRMAWTGFSFRFFFDFSFLRWYRTQDVLNQASSPRLLYCSAVHADVAIVVVMNTLLYMQYIKVYVKRRMLFAWHKTHTYTHKCIHTCE